jgi:hypothetical protein
MLGPRVLASQTYVLFWLYDWLYGAAGRQVHVLLRWLLRRWLALSFLWLKSFVSDEWKNEQCRKVTVPHYGSLAPNLRMLSCPSGACYQ